MIWINEEQKNRALKSFTNFIIECKTEVLDWKTNKYKCRHCYGSGRVISPSAFNDPVEGYKMADRVDCQFCNGTGESDVKSWKEFYKQEKISNEKHLMEKKELNSIKKAALKKLTNVEKKALNLQHY